jgi:hypothetical protein
MYLVLVNSFYCKIQRKGRNNILCTRKQSIQIALSFRTKRPTKRTIAHFIGIFLAGKKAMKLIKFVSLHEEIIVFGEKR